MYFFNIQQLSNELKDKRVTSKDKLKYFFAFLLLSPFNVQQYSDMIDPHPIQSFKDINAFGVCISLISIFIHISGVIYCYKANKQGDNEDFIERFVCLTLPATLRSLFYLIPVVIVYVIVAAIIGFDQIERIDPSHSIVNVVLQIIFYILVRSSILKISGDK